MTSTRNNNSCCGLYEVYGMDAYHQQDRVQLHVNNLIAFRDNGSNLSVFCTMTDEQCENQPVIDILHGQGFRLVARWMNANSGNMCNLFVSSRPEAGEFNDLPDNLRPMLKSALLRDPLIRMEVPVPAPAPEPVYRWVLYRIRFDENGLVNRKLIVNSWDEEPSNGTVQATINLYKNEARGRTERWRFSLEKELVVD